VGDGDQCERHEEDDDRTRQPVDALNAVDLHRHRGFGDRPELGN
jgi:hypothetical protein